MRNNKNMRLLKKHKLGYEKFVSRMLKNYKDYVSFFNKNRNIDDLTGFILKDGRIIATPDKEHNVVLSAFEYAVGLDERVLTNDFGAIRTRPGRVFLILDIPPDSLNVEIYKKPTKEQINILKRIENKVYYEFWDLKNCRDSQCLADGVSSKRFIEKLNDFWSIEKTIELKKLITKYSK